MNSTEPASTEHQREITARRYRPGVVHHVVLFRFRAEVPEVDRTEAARRFESLRSSPHRDGAGPYILSIAAGAQNSQEGLAAGFEVGFIVRFASEGDRNYYVGPPQVTDPELFDPQHARFKGFVGPLLAPENGVLVFDFAESTQ